MHIDEIDNALRNALSLCKGLGISEAIYLSVSNNMASVHIDYDEYERVRNGADDKSWTHEAYGLNHEQRRLIIDSVEFMTCRPVGAVR